ncbi:hypothetical protein CDD83_9265 [Cordyceps sp. RAO-2017]|nr:hypothetical protein CDD83_9265 [Cordyceps sp. RAO-2017]
MAPETVATPAQPRARPSPLEEAGKVELQSAARPLSESTVAERDMTPTPVIRMDPTQLATLGRGRPWDGEPFGCNGSPSGFTVSASTCQGEQTSVIHD